MKTLPTTASETKPNRGKHKTAEKHGVKKTPTLLYPSSVKVLHGASPNLLGAIVIASNVVMFCSQDLGVVYIPRRLGPRYSHVFTLSNE
jgi:hypothetical protein